MNPIFKQWDTAKSLIGTYQYEEALAIYEEIASKIEAELSDTLDKAMFFGDYFGALADVAQYDKAEAMAAKAFHYKAEGDKYDVLRYIPFNYGHLYLLQGKWEEAIPWLEKALGRDEKGGWISTKSEARYGTELGVALFYLERTGEAEEELLNAVKVGKATVVNQDWEPFFYLKEIYKQKGEEKLMAKYEKMYLTRLKKVKKEALIYPISQIQGDKQALEDWKKLLNL
ncbi:MAG: tetratricopeptide repeat protein [Capnocytophaga sp.]|nr:tetratricopeptide repeat protein [Capnocytophaga sp.]